MDAIFLQVLLILGKHWETLVLAPPSTDVDQIPDPSKYAIRLQAIFCKYLFKNLYSTK